MKSLLNGNKPNALNQQRFKLRVLNSSGYELIRTGGAVMCYDDRVGSRLDTIIEVF